MGLLRGGYEVNLDYAHGGNAMIGMGKLKPAEVGSGDHHSISLTTLFSSGC